MTHQPIEGWDSEIHPAAELFPLISDGQLHDLAEDIRANGLREPCWLNRDGVLLDGRNRIRACQKAGVKPDFRQYDGDDEVGFIVSLNLRRRHLNEDERAFLAVGLIPLYEEQGRAAMAHAGASAAPGRPEKGGAGLPHLSRDEAARSRAQAAKDVNVAARRVAQAKRIAEHAPDLIPQVTSGAVTISRAETIVKNRAAGIADTDGDAWFTPTWLFDQLGLTFDLDVCAPRDPAQRTAPARKYYTEDDDGLTQEWDGLIWCNPPYSKPEAWTDRVIAHGSGLLLTHMPNNAKWAVRAQQAATAARLIQSMHFVRPNGQTQRPGYSLMLLAYGQTAADALKAVEQDMVGPLWVPA